MSNYFSGKRGVLAKRVRKYSFSENCLSLVSFPLFVLSSLFVVSTFSEVAF